MRTLPLLLVAALTTACTAIANKPDLYTLDEISMKAADGPISLHLVKPAHPKPSQVMLLYATGDAGWIGASKVIFQHLADNGYPIVAYSSQRLVSNMKSSKEPVTFEHAAADVDAVLVESKKALGLPESTRVIVVGFSRGANLVVFVGGEPSLQRHIAGGIALALTAESDYIKPPDPRPPSIQLDDKGRILTYPALARFGAIPIAVIQSAGDSYVPAEQSRKLFGPNTDTRRLYEVDASNHGFSGGRDEMLKDLDEALEWIVATRTTPSGG